MRNKGIIEKIMIIVLTALFLSACSAVKDNNTAVNEATAESQEETVQTEAVTEEENDQAEDDTVDEAAVAEVSDNTVSMNETEEEPGGETIPTHAVLKVSETPHDEIHQLSDRIFWVKDGDTVSILDEDGNRFVDGNVTAAYTMFYDGYFYIDIDDVATLFDKEGSFVMDCSDYPGYYFHSVYEEGIQLSSKKKGTADSIYLNWQGDELFRVNDTVVNGLEKAGALVDGKIEVSTQKKQGENNSIPSYVNVDGTLGYIPYDESKYMYTGSYGNSSVKDGKIYIFAQAKDKRDNYVYDLRDKTMKKIHVDGNWSLKCLDGLYHDIFDDRYILAWNCEDENRRYAIYDFADEKFVTGYAYSCIEIGYYGQEKYILVSNAESGKWGFLDENLKETGTWYDDASAFVDGCAVVKDDTGLYVVNENFERISDSVEGDGSSRYAVLSGNYVDIYRGEKQYLAEIIFD